MLMTPARQRDAPDSKRRNRGAYGAPARSDSVWLRELLHSANRGPLTARQLDIFRSPDAGQADDAKLYYAGDLALVTSPCVSIVGTREASNEGQARARRLARELVNHGAVIVSGLARGIDAAAQTSAIENKGRTIAVIGTPLSMASPVRECATSRENLA